MDDMPKGTSMERRKDNGLSGLDPAELLKQGAGEDTFAENHPGGFTPPTLEELSEIFPRFEILELIGKGGMGAVYKVRQPELDRIVAMKILPPAIGLSPAFASRFTREAKALAKLNHPGIVTIHESGQEGGLYYILMEYVDGVNLRQLLTNGRISPREAMAIVPQICDALQFAHDQGIVHRDIKPENLLLDRLGRVKVADFGIAKLIGNDDPAATATHTMEATLTDGGKAMGTPQYMAPEQTGSPTEVDHRADIFALGVVFYQMLTGELPEKDLKAPSRKISLDVRLDEIVLRALENDPALRFSNVTEMKTRIEDMDSTSPVGSSSWNLNYRSSREIFGLPLLHVTTGTNPETGKERHAKGILAVGGKATGVIAVGGRAYGGIAFGGIAVGIIAFGGLSIGVISLGGIAFALYLALGGVAAGWAAIGGTTLGVYSYGSSPRGIHTLGPATEDAQAVEFFMPWAHILMANIGGIMFLAMAMVFLLAFGLPIFIANRKSTSPKSRGKYLVWSTLGLAIIALAASLQGPSIWNKHVEAPVPHTSIKPQESRPTDTVNTAPLPLSGEPALPSAEQLAAQPILRALNWQYGEQENAGDTWTPSGRIDTSGARLPPAVGMGVTKTYPLSDTPRFLQLWFSHPLIDDFSTMEIALFEKDGKTPLETPTGHRAGDTVPARPEYGDTGWITASRCVGTVASVPREITVNLRYSIGPWKYRGEIAPDFNGSMALGNLASTTSPGQDIEGNSIILVTFAKHPDFIDEQIDLVAIDKSGNRIERDGVGTYGGDDGYTRRFQFGISLNEVEKFKVRRRPIRVATYRAKLINHPEKSLAEQYIDLALQELIARGTAPQGSPVETGPDDALEHFLVKHPEFPNALSTGQIEEQITKKRSEITAFTKKNLTYENGKIETPEYAKLKNSFQALQELLEIHKQSELKQRILAKTLPDEKVDLKQREIKSVAAKEIPDENRLQVRLVSTDDPNAEDMELRRMDDKNEVHIQNLKISPDVIIWDKHLAEAAITQADGSFELGITLDETGAERLRKATMPGEKQTRLAIILDGELFSAPIVQSGPLGKNLVISGLEKGKAIDLLKSFPGSETQLKALEGLEWLSETDAGNYGKSYDMAAEFFRNAVTREEWIRALEKFRAPLGAGVTRRKLLELEEAETMPGAPDGEYRVFQFNSDLPRKRNAIETVTLTKESDGIWRTSGYFIR